QTIICAVYPRWNRAPRSIVRAIPKTRGERHETSPPTISASGRGRGRAAGRDARRLGASLPDAAGAGDRPVCARWTNRCVWPPYGTKVVQQLGKQFYVENIGGAGGNVGIGHGAKAAPDGYTILVVPPTIVVNPALYDKVPFDPYKDFDPVTIAVTSP